MPRISRDKIDLATTGHPCDSVAGCISTAKSVYINGERVLRPGDPLLPHLILVCTSDDPPQCFCADHEAWVNRGSFTVFAEGIPVARKGDSADMGRMIQGSHDVFADGF